MNAPHLPKPPATTPDLYEQDGKGGDAIVYAHFFVGGCDWLITEYDPATGRMYGWACLGDRQNAELGYVTHQELDRVRIGGIFGVDYETDWQPCTIREAIALVDTRAGRPVDDRLSGYNDDPTDPATIWLEDVNYLDTETLIATDPLARWYAACDSECEESNVLQMYADRGHAASYHLHNELAIPADAIGEPWTTAAIKKWDRCPGKEGTPES